MYVEDRLSHRGPFPIQVTETQTVLALKQQVEREFEIPVAVQRWILGKELASNDLATLKDLKVTNNGCPVFLYLVAPTSNNTKIKKENSDKKETVIVEKKELNVASSSSNEKICVKTKTTIIPIEKKEVNAIASSSFIDKTKIEKPKEIIIEKPKAPRIVEEKFKPIEKISDEKSQQILNISEYRQKDVSRLVADNLKASGSGLLKTEPPKAVEEDFTEYEKTLTPQKKAWECIICTLLNPLTTNICLVCASVRRKESPIGTGKRLKKKAPQTPQTKHYLELMNLDHADLVSNSEAFECLVCLTNISAGNGVTLRECLHQFCRECLANTVEFCDEAQVKCPYRDNQYSCDIALQDREIKSLVTPAMYDQFLAKSVKEAENKMGKSFHCKTPDCKGWCVFEDNVNEFRCPVCRRNNCLTCQAIHDGMNCKQYQERMNAESETDEDAKRTREMLEEMVNKGEALTCPACQVVMMKKWGCDWVRCSMCKTEICWVTRGLRWGPAGKGDTTGGCKCGVNGVKCHPQCNYCH